MKPPPRTRKTPNRIGSAAEAPPRAGRAVCQWPRAEQLKLVKALKAVQQRAEPLQDLDCSLLEPQLPGRPQAEICSVVELLKKQVISSTAAWLQKETQVEQSSRRPIQMWTQLAAAVTGRHEEVVTSAFSQILLVLSTEPCTLRHGHPPASKLKPPEPARTTSPLRIQTTTQLQVPSTPPAAACARLSPQAEPHRPLPSASPRTLVSPPTSSSSSSFTPPAAGLKPPTGEAFGTGRAKDVVDFERIYCFLSRIQESSESQQQQLTPMESAVVLDLLMFLPEELQLLDSNKLHKHLTQVGRCLSAPGDLKTSTIAFQEVRGVESHGQLGSQEEDRMDVPPLNPFMVPLKLLRRL
ncbi:unnamed protein product [Ophioblennius macclurei]